MQNTPRLNVETGFYENELSGTAIMRRIERLFQKNAHVFEKSLVERKVSLTKEEVREGIKKYLLPDDQVVLKSEVDIALSKWAQQTDAYIWRTECTCTVFFSKGILSLLPKAVYMCFVDGELVMLPDTKKRKHTVIENKDGIGRVSARSLVSVPIPVGPYAVTPFEDAWFLEAVSQTYCKVVEVKKL